MSQQVLLSPISALSHQKNSHLGRLRKQQPILMILLSRWRPLVVAAVITAAEEEVKQSLVKSNRDFHAGEHRSCPTWNSKSVVSYFEWLTYSCCRSFSSLPVRWAVSKSSPSSPCHHTGDSAVVISTCSSQQKGLVLWAYRSRQEHLFMGFYVLIGWSEQGNKKKSIFSVTAWAGWT